MERLSGVPVQPMEPGIGLNVFRHESGIHTAGMLIHPAIYQFIPPDDLGAKIEYGYGKHSGALVIEHALRANHVPFDDELVGRVMGEVKRVREERAERSDFGEFHHEYYEHLEHLGVSEDEVVEIATALSRQSEGF
jgi:isopropylmalate/homocitrate/citramalate synthase